MPVYCHLWEKIISGPVVKWVTGESCFMDLLTLMGAFVQIYGRFSPSLGGEHSWFSCFLFLVPMTNSAFMERCVVCHLDSSLACD